MDSEREILFRVGNDIVDLTNPRNRKKIQEPRFINRILVPDEQQQLFMNADPTRLKPALKEKVACITLTSPITFCFNSSTRRIVWG